MSERRFLTEEFDKGLKEEKNYSITAVIVKIIGVLIAIFSFIAAFLYLGEIATYQWILGVFAGVLVLSFGQVIQYLYEIKTNLENK